MKYEMVDVTGADGIGFIGFRDREVHEFFQAGGKFVIGLNKDTGFVVTAAVRTAVIMNERMTYEDENGRKYERVYQDEALETIDTLIDEHVLLTIKTMVKGLNKMVAVRNSMAAAIEEQETDDE